MVSYKICYFKLIINIREIVKMAGGSQIIIDDNGITISTGGKILYQAGQHKFEKGKIVASEVIMLPSLKEYDNSQKFKIVDENKAPISDITYLILDHNNQAHIGSTDAEGHTKRIFTPDPSKIKLFYGAKAIEKMKQLGLK